jgi:AraC-like DNA-binding protein
MSSRIKKIVSDGLLVGCIPTVQTVSRAMKVSARTLQNYLQREDTTFTAIFEASRKELARHLLKDSAYNLKYICATLGFCDKSSFHKASLRWFGMTPQKYRELAE